MHARRSLHLPIALAVVMILMLLALTVGWVILAVRSALDQSNWAPLYWALLSVGATFFVLIVVGVVLYLTLSIKAINITRRQSNFIDSVTHELKSPIASLKLYLQTLRRRHLTVEEQQEFYGRMLEDVERLDRLINHVLDAARLEKDTSDHQLQSVRLDQLLQQCAEEVCRRYEVAPSTVQLDLQPCAVTAWPLDLELIFRNLLDNAVKYAGQPPEVTVAISEPAPGRVSVWISDNGRGIPRNLRRKIFGRFVRLGTELEREQPGLGLGLYIVRTLVARLRGRIRVREREAAAGSTFEVRLRGRFCCVVAVRQFGSGHFVRRELARGARLMAHILVVEDERHLAQGIKFNLELEGYDVSTVDNGVAAMQWIQRDDPAVDLVILDLMLPGMSGYAVCQELRALGAEIPVLILSARTLTEDRTRGFEAGADQYLTKPFELDELLAPSRDC